ncbi:MAG: hypothetical protein IH998_14960, partial [Proteobacteria bacterium]|nr:hypothetical protein [Pseudomonadota bacterium]
MMVAIFTGAGTGFERGSGSVLGSSGLLGSAGLGRGGEQVFLNAANGNLLISRQDEFLVGRGPDAGVGRTYNSLGNHSDDNGDNWLQSTDRRVFGLTGAANSWGSTVKRRSADGSEISYGWDGTSYVTTDGAGSFDRLRYDGSSWTWTDGDSRVTETYSAFAGHWRIASLSDTSGNALTYGYTGDKLTTLTTANGETLTYVWSGDHISEVISGDGASTVYAYDGHGRLSRVTVALSPGGSSYSTWYGYVGATTLVSRIEQSDGSILDIGYDAVDRVTSLAQTVASGATRTTGIAYGVGYAIVTDPAGQATRLDYAPGNLVPDIATWPRSNLATAPATIDGAAATRFEVTGAGWAAIKWALTAAPGDTLTYAVTLQGSGDGTAASIGLYGTISGWGDNGWALARIVSGPGTLSREAGGLFNITGLSTTAPTRIEITRSYDRAETGGIDIYVDRPLGMRAGRSLLIGAVTLTPGIAAQRANQLTGITSGYGTDQARTVQFGYNANGDLTGVTDSMGQATAYTYDANGNLLTTTDRLGNVVTRTYDAANQLLTETRIGSDKDGAAAAHTIRHVHDGANRLRFTIDAEGGVTEYDYGADGLLRLTQQYRGKFDLSGLGTASAPSEAQMVAWTGTVEPTEIMITELRYDVRGNLTQKLRYGGAYAPGSPHEADGLTQEYYSYDLAGRLLSSFVAGRNRETYVYDGLGRLTAKTDVNEGTTSFVFNDAAMTDARNRIASAFEHGRDVLGISDGAEGEVAAVEPDASLEAAFVREELLTELQDRLDVALRDDELDLLLELNFSTDVEQVLTRAVTSVLSRDIVASKERLLASGRAISRRELISKLTQLRRDYSNILSTEEAGELLVVQIANHSDLRQAARRKLASIGARFVAPTLTFEFAETERERVEARLSVDAVYYQVQRGKTIVRAGDEIDENGLRQLQILSAEQDQRWGLAGAVGALLLAGVVLLIQWYLLRPSRMHDAWRRQSF